MNPNYQMGWLAEVTEARIDDLNAGKYDVDDIVLLYQDLIEAGMFPVPWCDRAVYMLQMGLIHVMGRALQ